MRSEWTPDPMFTEPNWREEVAPVPPHVFCSKRLDIDDVIRRRFAGRTPTVMPERRENAVIITRRALAVAIRYAVNSRIAPREDWEWIWENLRDEATNAHAAMEKAIGALEAMTEWLPPRIYDDAGRELPPDPDAFVRRRKGTACAIGLVRTRYEAPGLRARLTKELSGRARKDIAAMFVVRRALSRLVSDAERRRRWHTSQIGNPALSERGPFVMVLAEAWLYLTGRLPSINGEDNTPFDEFIRAGWTDWTGKECNFSFVEARRDAVRALRQMRSRFSNPSHWEPMWADMTEPLLHDLRVRQTG